MKTKITFLFLLVSLSGFSQALGWMWADNSGGNSYDEATSVTTDISGNVYVCGSFYNDTIVFGTDTLRTAGTSDIFLAKVSNMNGIENSKNQTAIFTYPNPSSGKFTIQSENNFSGTIFITNILGELIYSTDN